MDGEEDDEGSEALNEGKPEAAAEEADVESCVYAAKLVKAVFGEGEDLLDPAERVLSG